MIMLARDACGDMGVFEDQSGNLIEWSLISKLHRVLKKYILHLGNKIKTQHVRWQNYKMTVKVAAPTLRPGLYVVPMSRHAKEMSSSTAAV